MKEVLNNIWLSSVVIFVFQIIFVYLRTINVIYTADKKTFAAIITGALSGLFWILSTAIGVAAIMEGDWQPIVAHLFGGALGTYWGIESKAISNLMARIHKEK